MSELYPVKERRPDGSKRLRDDKPQDGRYDSEGYVEMVRQGIVPRIHQPFIDMMQRQERHWRGPVCDLGASTGVLARSIHEHFWWPVCAIEGNQASIDAGVYADPPPIPVLADVIERDRIALALDFMTAQEVRTVTARRTLSEIDGVPELAQGLKAIGVRALFIQGRQPRANATHPVPDVHAEIALLDGWDVVWQEGELAALTW